MDFNSSICWYKNFKNSYFSNTTIIIRKWISVSTIARFSQFFHHINKFYIFISFNPIYVLFSSWKITITTIIIIIIIIRWFFFTFILIDFFKQKTYFIQHRFWSIFRFKSSSNFTLATYQEFCKVSLNFTSFLTF
jgi:hypothetical protein